MTAYMIKVAGEGLISKAHRLSDPGPTPGSSVIYDVQNVPDDKSLEEVIEVVKAYKGQLPHNDAYEVDFAVL